MGIMGPRRVVTPVVGHQAPPPYTLEDNAYTLLDIADIVMIDPVGTGFSRPVGDTPGSDFWGIDEDAAAVRAFCQPGEELVVCSSFSKNFGLYNERIGALTG